MIKNPTEDGKYIGDTFYGDSDNSTSPTHIWDKDDEPPRWISLDEYMTPKQSREVTSFVSTDRQVDQSCRIERPYNVFLDSILGKAFPVLDHGFVRVIDYMGDDNAIDQAARVSYGAGTRQVTEARGLINTMMREWHSSPFEMCEIKLHVKLPIFVMRQWVRHRTASLNEYSARYSVVKEEFHLPDLNQLRKQSQTNKQGRAEQIDANLSIRVRDHMRFQMENDFDLYAVLIGDETDLARELARINLPLSTYTEMYWKIDLHNLFGFLRQRNDSHAQHEIKVYGEVIEQMVQGWVPLAHEAYVNYRKNALTFSVNEQKLIAFILQNPQCPVEAIRATGSGLEMSKREVNQFLSKWKAIV